MSAAQALAGQRVRLRGLSRDVLNGAFGVAGALDAATGRIPVRLEGPQAALDAFPDNVKARRGALGLRASTEAASASAPGRQSDSRRFYMAAPAGEA